MNDCATIWANCLTYIRENVGEQPYITWFKPIVPLRYEDGALTIQVPSQFFYEWLEENYVQLLRKAIDQEIGKHGRLEYSVIVDNGNSNNKPVSINLPNQNRQKAMASMNGNSYESFNGNFQPDTYKDAFMYQTALESELCFRFIYRGRL
jgi:chromosomal replication initiator protein